MVVGDISTGTEVAVVGGGPGGYTAAIRAGQHDLDVTLVEDDALGGTCLNHGCIPSKALVEATGLAHRADNAENLGIEAEVDVDTEGMQAWKSEVVEGMRGGVEKLCKANGVSVVNGRGVFEDENRLRVEGENGSESFEFENAVVATGSRPVEMDGFEFDGDTVLSSRHALSLDEVPESLVVVGAGYIGMEMSNVFAKLGVDVSVVEALERSLVRYPEDVARVVRKRSEELGVEFSFGERALGYDKKEDGEVVVRTEGDEGERTHICDTVLVAVGREPVTENLGLGNLGVETDDRGFLATDRQARTDADHVFAVGDVAGEPMLAHKAGEEGRVAAEVIAGESASLDYQAMPSAVFTDPEVATVGMTRDEAESEGFEATVGEFPMRASGRALTMDETDGFVRLVADVESGFVLGGQAVGPEASELVAEIGLAVEMGANLDDLAATVHTHPTLSETVKEAAENALNEAIHTLNR